MMRREKAYLPKPDKITIKKNKKTGVTKLKLRTPRYLYTHSVDDKSKADKIMQSIPPNLKKVYPDSKK
jgi:pyridoxine 5'-phosphate synthase PdxJ